ncbi:hypothetical protein D3C72_1383270 [compost metagenome]
MRMLGAQLPTNSRTHSYHQRNLQLSARHVLQCGGIIHNLIHREQTEINGHDFNNRFHASHGSTNSGTYKTGFRKRNVHNPLFTKFL